MSGHTESSFVWDPNKEIENKIKHGVDFVTASKVFKDPGKQIFIDEIHSMDEERLFCIGKVEDRVLTVRFCYRDEKIRIIGAGYWREGRKWYEKI